MRESLQRSNQILADVGNSKYSAYSTEGKYSIQDYDRQGSGNGIKNVHFKLSNYGGAENDRP
jgi:hypothetical protein